MSSVNEKLTKLLSNIDRWGLFYYISLTNL